MITEIFLNVDDSQATARVCGKITEKAVGILVHVTIEGERWDGLSARFVATCDGVSKTTIIADGDAVLPWECLIAKKKLYIGVDGVNESGELRIPTILVYCGEVAPSPAGLEPDNVSDPTPDIVDQILAAAESAVSKASDVERRANEHEFDGSSVSVSTEEVEDGNEVTFTDADGDHTILIKDGKNPEKCVTSVNGRDGDVTIDVADVENIANVAKSGSYNDLVDTPDIPDKMSQLENDGDYVVIEDIPEWSMAQTKPSYTASEVGTLPIKVMTKAEYDSIAIKEQNTAYFIVEV